MVQAAHLLIAIMPFLPEAYYHQDDHYGEGTDEEHAADRQQHGGDARYPYTLGSSPRRSLTVTALVTVVERYYDDEATCQHDDERQH